MAKPLRQPAGYLTIMEPDRPLKEQDSLFCHHCGAHFWLVAGKSPEDTQASGYCGRCHATICSHCADEMDRTLKCLPFEKWLEQVEERARVVAQYLP